MNTQTQLLQRLWPYITPYRKILLAALLGLMLLAISLLILPLLIMQFVDDLFINPYQVAIHPIILVTILFFVLRGAISYSSNFAIHTVGNQVSKDLQRDIFNKILSLSITNQSALSKDQLASHFFSDLNQLRQALVKVITLLSKDLLTIAGLTAWMFHLSGLLSLLALFVIILTTITLQLINDHFHNINQKLFKITADTINGLLETIRNYKFIKLSGAQSYEGERFMSHIKQINRFNLKQATAKTLCISLAQIVCVIILMVAIALTNQQFKEDQITPGEISAFILAALMMAFHLKQISLINHYWQQGKQALKTIFVFLDQQAEVESGTVTIKEFQGELTFDNVSLYSEAQPILRNLDFTIKSGKVVVLAGATEESKTALIDLMLRFQNPTNGCIMYDGHNLADINLTDLYTNIALIPEKPVLRGNTTAANITYGALQCANEAEIIAVAHAAHAITFIREMPRGLQTRVDNNETELTNEQCLHIAIAHALLKNPAIVILEQVFPTADLNSDSLNEALKTLMQGRTTLIITQQLHPSLKQADRIITI